MPEAVRLVIWDLDETFWRGTVTEGGIQEYIRAHHDIVIELARRGIMSSICSKNDFGIIKTILVENDIWDYFIFPSINWEPKGQRVAAIVDAVQLRPETIMFVDDNPGNRGEVAAVVPGIEVADELFIREMLASPLFKGKDDQGLTRLAQYKVLERRKADEVQAGGDNHAFLRSSKIRVVVEGDVAAQIDRAVELVNRTNQLNFTKTRLPNDAQAARETLLAEVAKPGRAAGLVHVADNYGDYGFIGFFLLDTAALEPRLIHYCFSCRTLGMNVETWLYDQLGRPAITVSGDVLTDLGVRMEIDWIQSVSEIGAHAHEPLAKLPEIRMLGGCEANSISHYFEQNAEKVVIEAPFANGRLFIRGNSSAMLLSALDRDATAFAAEMDLLGIPPENMVTRFLDPVQPGSLLVFSCQLDSGYCGYRHKHYGWHIKIEFDSFWDDVTQTSDEQIVEYVTRHQFDAAAAARIRHVAGHIREAYFSIRGPSEQDLTRDMHRIFSLVPVGARLVVLAPGDRVRSGGEMSTLQWVTKHNLLLPNICAGFPFVRLVQLADCVDSDDDIAEGWNHYDRPVYFRIAQSLLAAAQDLPAKEPALELA